MHRALGTSGGHLAIGRGGYTLHYDRGCRVSGYACEAIKGLAVGLVLPVINSRGVPFEIAARLALGGLMNAVGETSDEAPFGSFSFAPLCVVAAPYRAAGAEVLNALLTPDGLIGEKSERRTVLGDG